MLKVFPQAARPAVSERKRTSISQACATFRRMPHPCLLFCPYIAMDQPVEFADWEQGPLRSFEDRWAEPKFKAQAIAFLCKFFGTHNKPIDNPALLCRKGKQLDGQQPSQNEMRALELSLAFAFVDCNPRTLPANQDERWAMVTTDNAELYLWPIDLKQGRVTTNTGYMVLVRTGGYKISNDKLILRPPLDLDIPPINLSPDPLVLTGIYKTVLGSLCSPGEDPTADRVRVAVNWLAKAWRNTATIHFPERLVFLKTAFEALTGTSKTHESARKLRQIFEESPNTAEKDSEFLVWSPEEKRIIPRSWRDKVWSNSDRLRHGPRGLVHGVRWRT